MMTPVAAKVPAIFEAVNPPRRIRNSPTKPFMLGSPIDASVKIRKRAENIGITVAVPP